MYIRGLTCKSRDRDFSWLMSQGTSYRKVEHRKHDSVPRFHLFLTNLRLSLLFLYLSCSLSRPYKIPDYTTIIFPPCFLSPCHKVPYILSCLFSVTSTEHPHFPYLLLLFSSTLNATFSLRPYSQLRINVTAMLYCTHMPLLRLSCHWSDILFPKIKGKKRVRM